MLPQPCMEHFKCAPCAPPALCPARPVPRPPARPPAGDFVWGSASFHKMGRQKVELARAFLGFGLDLCLCDVDTVWISGEGLWKGLARAAWSGSLEGDLVGLDAGSKGTGRRRLNGGLGGTRREAGWGAASGPNFFYRSRAQCWRPAGASMVEGSLGNWPGMARPEQAWVLLDMAGRSWLGPCISALLPRPLLPALQTPQSTLRASRRHTF